MMQNKNFFWHKITSNSIDTWKYELAGTSHKLLVDDLIVNQLLIWLNLHCQPELIASKHIKSNLMKTVTCMHSKHNFFIGHCCLLKRPKFVTKGAKTDQYWRYWRDCWPAASTHFIIRRGMTLTKLSHRSWSWRKLSHTKRQWLINSSRVLLFWLLQSFTIQAQISSNGLKSEEPAGHSKRSMPSCLSNQSLTALDLKRGLLSWTTIIGSGGGSAIVRTVGRKTSSRIWIIVASAREFYQLKFL